MTIIIIPTGCNAVIGFAISYVRTYMCTLQTLRDDKLSVRVKKS